MTIGKGMLSQCLSNESVRVMKLHAFLISAHGTCPIHTDSWATVSSANRTGDLGGQLCDIKKIVSVPKIL